MSDFLAEARVIVIPDTTKFRAELEAQLVAATKAPLIVPVQAQVLATAPIANTAAFTAAVEEQAAASQLAGLRSVEAAAGTTALTKAQTAGTAAAHALAVAQEEVVGAATAAQAATIRHTRSVAAVAAAEKAQATAVAAGNKALQVAAAEHIRLAEAEHANALAALENARAQATQAATSSQVQRAFVAQAAGAAGLRGAVLSSTVAFIAATVAAVAIGKSIKGASDLNEEINKTKEVFGQSADAILKWSETTASSIGTARVEALAAIGTFGELFRTLGVGTPKAAALSQELVTVSADLASFFNKSNQQALQALQSGLVGQARPLRQFGIFLTEARVKAEALVETGKKNVDSLTQQDRILARYNLILQDAAIAAGDFQRTQDQLANQSRTLQANLSDLGNTIGNVLLPNVEAAVQDTNKLFFALGKLKDFKAHITLEIETRLPGGENGLAARILGEGVGFLGPGGILKANLLGLSLLGKGLDAVGLSAQHMNDEIRKTPDGLAEMERDARGSKALIDALAASLERAANAAGNLGKRLTTQALGLEAGGASLSGRIAKQKEIIENDKILVAQARKTGKAGLIQDALRQQIADQNELESLQNEVLSGQKEAATEAEHIRGEQDAAIQRQFEAITSPTERLLARAGLTEPLKDDIKFTTQLIELYKKQIAQAAKRIQDVQTRNQVLTALGDKLFQAIIERRRLAREERQRIRDALVERIERIQRGTELDIELADINENTKRRIALREKLIAQLKNERKKLHLTGNALKENRNEIARINAEIEGIKKETKKTGKSFAELTFEFLQTQQGFAANLLGNLIPGGATGGLVGNVSPAGQQLTLPQPGAAVQRESAIAAGRDLGFSRGQGDTTNALLRKILASLQHLNGRAGHPEARHNRAVGSAMMDTMGGIHGA